MTNLYARGMLLTSAIAKQARRGFIWRAVTSSKPTHHTAKNFATYWANFKAYGSGGTPGEIG